MKMEIIVETQIVRKLQWQCQTERERNREGERDNDLTTCLCTLDNFAPYKKAFHILFLKSFYRYELLFNVNAQTHISAYLLTMQLNILTCQGLNMLLVICQNNWSELFLVAL